MINKSQVYSQAELKAILSWRENKITPQSIFGLKEFGNFPGQEELLAAIFQTPVATCPYDATTVEKKHKFLKIKSHPDKYRQTEYQAAAQAVFQLLDEAREYLLFTIDNSYSILNTNVFYAYYYLNWVSNETPQGKFDNITRQVCELKNQNLDCTQQILALCELIETTPELIHHIRDPRHFSYELSHKNIFYFSVQWNEPELLDWLLVRFPEEKNVLTPTEFGVSPLDFAINKGERIEILKTLQTHYGKEWLKVQLDSYLDSTNRGNKIVLLDYYEKLFPEAISTVLDKPLMLPALIEAGKVLDPDSTRLKRAIIGCPQMYMVLDESQRLDPYMIIAFLAQKPNDQWLHWIPLDRLDPKFAIALADQWPALKHSLGYALRRDAPPYPNYCSYAGFQKACLGVLIGVSLALLVWHFWPIIALWPEPLQILIVYNAMAIIPVCLIMGSMAMASYLYSIYPEARKINSILHNNRFFAPPPGGDMGQAAAANQTLSSVERERPRM